MSAAVLATPLSPTETPQRGIRRVRVGPLAMVKFEKPSVDKADYFVDFRGVLEGAETIVAASAYVVDSLLELRIERVEFGAYGVLVWAVGGKDRGRYRIVCQITTSAGETKQAEFLVETAGDITVITGRVETAGVTVPARDAPSALTPNKGFLMFTGVPVNGTSAAQSVVLTNAGPSAIPISSIAAGAYYDVAHDCPASLAAGDFCTINVSAKPKVSGRSGGALTILGGENQSLPLITVTS